MSSKDNIKSEATTTKTFRRHTPEEKAALVEQYYKIPQPCSQRDAAAFLGISQASFSRLFRASNNIEEKKVQVKKEESDKTKVYVDSTGKLKKRLTNKEKVDILDRYERLQPCTQRKAAAMLGVPQSTLSDILKTNDFIEEIEEPCKGKKSKKAKQENPIKLALRPSTRKSTFFTKLDLETLEGGDASDSSWTSNVNHSNSSDDQDSSDESDDPNVIPNQKKERNQRRKRSYMSEEDKIELYKKYLDLPPCTQKEASKVLGIGQSTLCLLLKKFSNEKSLPKPSKRAKAISKEEISSGAATFTVMNKKSMMPLEEKIKLLRKFDEMQPCSQVKAANTFGISYTTFTNVVNSRAHLEDDFKNKLPKKIEILKKYDVWLADSNKNNSNNAKGFPLSKEKLDNLLNHREFLEQEFKNYDLSAHERVVHGRQDVEAALMAWYLKNSQSQITWTELMEKAKELAANLDGKEFNPTVKWMMSWKRRLYAFNKNKSCKLGERVDLNESGSILPALKDYHPDNIFNMDETGLYYRAIPGLPDKSDWVTVVFACNMSGNEKIKPLVIGKMELPMFLSIVSLPVEYKYESRAQMSGKILSDYLKEWDRQLAETNRSIALILDNCGSHSTEDLSFKQIRLYLVPSEAASSCQPLRSGIISQTKTLYRQKLQDSLNKMAGDNNTVAELVSKMSLMDSMFILGTAWEEMPSKPIITAFSELVFPTKSGPCAEVEDEDIYRLNQLDEDIQVHPNEDSLDFLDPGISNEEFTVVHMDGILPSDDEDNGVSEVDESCGDEQETQDYEGTEIINSSADGNAKERGDSLPAMDTLDLLSENLPSNGGKKTCGSWLEQDALSVPEGRLMLNTSSETLSDDLPGPSVIDISGVQVTNKNLLEGPSDPPNATEVRKALNVIKRFLKSNGGTLEDLTDYTQLENKVLSKL